MSQGLRIRVPHGGAGALIYYQGFSEPQTARFVMRFLRPGMTFIDIGAHVGEYTLLAAQAVGEAGEVHSFEPNPQIFGLLRENVCLNGFSNVRLLNHAVSDRDGHANFKIFSEPSISRLDHGSSQKTPLQPQDLVNTVTVPTLRLDTYLGSPLRRVDLIKVDVEGAEQLVFLGATNLLSLPSAHAPVWIFEFSRENYAKFGFEPDGVREFLMRHEYRTWSLDGSPACSGSRFANIVAAKEGMLPCFCTEPSSRPA